MFKENAQRLVRADWLAPALDALRGELTPEKLKQSIECIAVGHKQMMEELSLVLADQNITMVHAGPFNAERTDSDAPGRTGSEEASEMIAPLRTLNHSSYYDPDHVNPDGTTGAVVGGFAGVSKGVWRFCHNGNLPDVLINGGVFRKLVQIGCPGTGIRFTNMLGVVQWAKATGNHSLGSAGPSWDSTVSANVVTDETGATTTGETVTIYLRRTTTGDPNVRTNEVIPFYYDYSGKAFCAADVTDGKIGEKREILDGDPADYPSRGWYIADGTNSTVNAGGGVSYGYTGVAPFDTVGGSVAVALTGATISGSGTAALTIASFDLGTHGHSHTLAAPAHTHTYSGTVNAESSHTHTIAITGNSGTTGTGSADVAYPGVDSFTTSAGSSHDHGFSGTTSGASATALTGSITDANLGSHGHPGSTVSISDVASGLTLGTPTAIRPAGYTTLVLQRMN